MCLSRMPVDGICRPGRLQSHLNREVRQNAPQRPRMSNSASRRVVLIPDETTGKMANKIMPLVSLLMASWLLFFLSSGSIKGASRPARLDSPCYLLPGTIGDQLRPAFHGASNSTHSRVTGSLPRTYTLTFCSRDASLTLPTPSVSVTKVGKARAVYVHRPVGVANPSLQHASVLLPSHLSVSCLISIHWEETARSGSSRFVS